MIRFLADLGLSSTLPDWDAALAQALVALTGSDQLYNQPDGASHFTRLRERSNIYWVKPEVYYVPLRHTEKKSRLWWHREEDQVLRDSPVQPLLAKMKRRVKEEDERAYHQFFLGGRFTGQDVRDLLSHSEMIHTPGNIDVLVSQMIPKTYDTGFAEYYLVDFVAPPGQLKPLIGLAHDDRVDDVPDHSSGNGNMSREELVELLIGPNGKYGQMARRVEESIKRIIEIKGN